MAGVMIKVSRGYRHLDYDNDNDNDNDRDAKGLP